MLSPNFKSGLHIFFVVLQSVTVTSQFAVLGIIAFAYVTSVINAKGGQELLLLFAVGLITVILAAPNFANIFFLLKRYFWARVFAVATNSLLMLPVAAFFIWLSREPLLLMLLVVSAFMFTIAYVAFIIAGIICIIYWLLPISGAVSPTSN
ncbi:MAG: hypothetical protein H7Z37_00900 [Pyrinomonadaceae bacterium]|nr:hypothetical protein [Pyrinomonadaceae bacterium]